MLLPERLFNYRDSREKVYNFLILKVANKMRIIDSLFVIFAALMAAAPVWANESKLVHLLRFSDYESGPVEDWLQGKGFQFKEDANDGTASTWMWEKRALFSKLNVTLLG